MRKEQILGLSVPPDVRAWVGRDAGERRMTMSNLVVGLIAKGIQADTIDQSVARLEAAVDGRRGGDRAAAGLNHGPCQGLRGFTACKPDRKTVRSHGAIGACPTESRPMKTSRRRREYLSLLRALIEFATELLKRL